MLSVGQTFEVVEVIADKFAFTHFPERVKIGTQAVGYKSPLMPSITHTTINGYTIWEDEFRVIGRLRIARVK
jgi:hypothetical protein